MTFALGMMQTAANEGEAREEETKGTGGPCVCVWVCVSLEYQEWIFESDRQIRAAILPLGGASFCNFIY